jgi:hypothetical protein
MLVALGTPLLKIVCTYYINLYFIVNTFLISRVPQVAIYPVCRTEHWRFCRDQPEGARHGSRALPEGQEVPSGKPQQKCQSAGSKRHPGRHFFGYFLLAKQKKVSRLPVRELVSKQSSR